MKVFIARLVLAVTLIPAALLAQQVEYDTHFTPRGMRVDYFHSGGMGKEIFALDRVVDDGAWAGSRKALLDPLGFGKYQFTVADAKSSKPIYSRGFASIYGEWETTGEQEKTHRTFHESFRFPWPKHPVKITLRKRAADNRSWNDLWSLEVDPNSRFVNPSHPRPAGELVPIFENGDPTKKVDLLVSVRATRRRNARSSFVIRIVSSARFSTPSHFENDATISTCALSSFPPRTAVFIVHAPATIAAPGPESSTTSSTPSDMC